MYQFSLGKKELKAREPPTSRIVHRICLICHTNVEGVLLECAISYENTTEMLFI